MLYLLVAACTVALGESRESSKYSLDTGMSASLSNYDPDLALNMAYFAAAAYCNKSSLEQWDCSHCHNISTVARAVVVNTTAYGSSVQAFVAKITDGGVVVSYRGTEGNELINWIVDIAFFPKNVSYPGCEGCGALC